MRDIERGLKNVEDDLPTSRLSAADVMRFEAHRRGRSRWAAWVVGSTIAASLIAGTLFLRLGSRPETSGAPGSDAGSSILGPDLARELGLEPIEGPRVQGCEYAVKLDEGSAYCLDTVVTTDEEAFVLSHMILGQEPTDAELELFALGQSLEDLPNGDEIDAEQRAKLERIVALMQEIDRASPAG